MKYMPRLVGLASAALALYRQNEKQLQYCEHLCSSRDIQQLKPTCGATHPYHFNLHYAFNTPLVAIVAISSPTTSMPALRGPFPKFWRQPIQYSRWAAHEKPALFYSVLVGGTGPILVLFAKPIRRIFGIKTPEATPVTYPSMSSPDTVLRSTIDALELNAILVKSHSAES